jgi:hypothetical protein
LNAYGFVAGANEDLYFEILFKRFQKNSICQCCFSMTEKVTALNFRLYVKSKICRPLTSCHTNLRRG